MAVEETARSTAERAGKNDGPGGKDNPKKSEREELWAELISPAGYILAVSYPVLALSTGVRAGYQLFVRTDIIDYLPVLLSALAAVCYLTATVGFAYRRRWSWWLSVGVLGFETIMTLSIGIWSIIEPEVVGRTVWRRFGEDYGYFPLFQPLIGLVWLLWPQTMAAYDIRKRSSTTGSPAPPGPKPDSNESLANQNVPGNQISSKIKGEVPPGKDS